MAMYVRYGGVDFEVAEGPAVGVSDVAERIDAALSRPDSPWLAVRTTRGTVLMRLGREIPVAVIAGEPVEM
jgi:hypothetical protein